MAFNGNISISLGPTPLSFIITDTSAGTDAGLTDRRVTLYLSDGTTLVPTGSSTPYIDWPIANGPITISLLSRDYSINVNTIWVSSSPLPSPSTYTISQIKTFTGNLQLFDYGLTQMMTANKLLAQDDHFLSNKELLQMYIENAESATVYNDQFNAQSNLDAGYELQLNQNVNF